MKRYIKTKDVSMNGLVLGEIEEIEEEPFGAGLEEPLSPAGRLGVFCAVFMNYVTNGKKICNFLIIGMLGLCVVFLSCSADIAEIFAKKNETGLLAAQERNQIGNVSEKVRINESLRGNLVLMKRDITYRGVDANRMKEYDGLELDTSKREVSESIVQEYFVVYGLYAWHLHLRTAGDVSWKEITEKCFRLAKQHGAFNAFSVCPEGWTIDTRIMWEDQQ